MACPTANPTAIAASTKDISVTNKETLSFNVISTLFTGASCINPKSVTCKVDTAPTNVQGITTTLAANPTITATASMVSVGFTEILTVTCEFDPTSKTDTKSVKANAYTIKQNCNPVAKPWFTINTATYDAKAAATSVGSYNIFFTESASSCYKGAMTTSGGKTAYVAGATTCVLSSPTSTSFTIGAKSPFTVSATPNVDGGFNQTVGITCTFPPAYIGTANVITS